MRTFAEAQFSPNSIDAFNHPTSPGHSHNRGLATPVALNQNTKHHRVRKTSPVGRQVMDENVPPGLRTTTVATAHTTSTTTAAQSTNVTIKREDGGPYQPLSSHTMPDNDAFALSRLHAEMEVIFEDDMDEEEEEAEVINEETVVVKFGPHHGSSNLTKFGRNALTGFNKLETFTEEAVPRTDHQEESGSDDEAMGLKVRKRRKTRTGRANTTAITTTATKSRRKATMTVAAKSMITKVFSPDSSLAHGNVHVYPLPPDQRHRHSYHNPLLLSFPGSTEVSSGQDSIAAARKHRDALLNWFDNHSAAHEMPWRKPWADPTPLLFPSKPIIPARSKPTPTSRASFKPKLKPKPKPEPKPKPKPKPKLKPEDPIPESLLIFPNLYASAIRARAEAAEAERQAEQAKAEAERRARQAKAEAEKQAQDLQTLRSNIHERFYPVYLAEIMRQVLPKGSHGESLQEITAHYAEWMQALPTLEDLAKASENDVQGLLKKDVRVRSFRTAAGAICQWYGHNNKVSVGLPTTSEELQELPGVGPHIAGVIAAVVFGRAEPMVDIGVQRVLTRQMGIRGDVYKKEGKEVVWEAARRLVVQVAWDGVEAEEEKKEKGTQAETTQAKVTQSTTAKSGNKKGKRNLKDMSEGENAVDMGRNNRGPPPLSDRPGRWGQALMDLAAAICLPAPEKPKCELCPIQATCRAYAEGLELARENGLVVEDKTTRKEKDSKQKLVDIEDAACKLCPPPSAAAAAAPPPPPPPAPAPLLPPLPAAPLAQFPPSVSAHPAHPSVASSPIIKKVNQEEINLGHPSLRLSPKIKQENENQDDILWPSDEESSDSSDDAFDPPINPLKPPPARRRSPDGDNTDPDVYYLGTIPKTPPRPSSTQSIKIEQAEQHTIPVPVSLYAQDLGFVPKTPLPSINEENTRPIQTIHNVNSQTTYITQPSHTTQPIHNPHSIQPPPTTHPNITESPTISTTFYQQDIWLRTQVEQLNLTKTPPPPAFLALLAKEFIASYCRQYPLPVSYWDNKRREREEERAWQRILNG